MFLKRKQAEKRKRNYKMKRKKTLKTKLGARKTTLRSRYFEIGPIILYLKEKTIKCEFE